MNLLNKDTRDYDSIPVETLQKWAVSVGAEFPGNPDDVTPISIQWAPPQVVQDVERYYNERETNFNMDEIGTLMDQFYAIPQDAKTYYQVGVYKKGKKKGQPKMKGVSVRDTYLNQHPELDQYFGWRKAFMKQAPWVQAYLDEKKRRRDPYGLQESDVPAATQFSDAQWRLATAYVFTRRTMPALTRKAFEAAWKEEAPALTFDQWLTSRIAGEFTQAQVPAGLLTSGQGG